mmetsp:Transcript_63273/g.77454  ORF Transcript_63273/g.77454 Transcript_63273/m.77454 type:complete len:239 (+) Transcript_63273:266-982(+)
MFDAASIGQLDDGALTTAGTGPRDDAGVPKPAAAHGHAEDAREAALEDGLAVAGQPTASPAALATDFAFKAALQIGAVVGVVHKVNVELVDGAMARRVHNQGAAGTTATGAGGVHAAVVIAHVVAVDILNTVTGAPHLVTTLAPAPTLGFGHLWFVKEIIDMVLVVLEVVALVLRLQFLFRVRILGGVLRFGLQGVQRTGLIPAVIIEFEGPLEVAGHQGRSSQSDQKAQHGRRREKR